MLLFRAIEKIQYFRWGGRVKYEMCSLHLRKKFQSKFNIVVGLYSYGCFDSSRIYSGTNIGRYCSFSSTARIIRRNHNSNFLSMTPYLYDPEFNVVSKYLVDTKECEISDDVWMGHNSIILSSVKTVGRGAVIGAGAIVTKDVPPYSIVAGNPAKIIRYRFTEDIIAEIEALRWWTWSAEELADRIRDVPDLVFSPAEHLIKPGDS